MLCDNNWGQLVHFSLICNLDCLLFSEARSGVAG
uniref:Uncharacterized protein n=1 Tax=Anguilla anguilla TaxID=7936 RepID=A0A0E9VG36_ANGAN